MPPPAFDIAAAVGAYIRRSPPARRKDVPKKDESLPKGEKLTFGVELEFLLAYQAPSEEFKGDPDPDDPRPIHKIVQTKTDTYMLYASREQRDEAHQHITDTLIEAGVSARSEWDFDFPTRPQQFVVADDSSVVPRDEDGRYSYMSTEVKSPPFYYQKEALLQVSGVLQSLTSTYRLVCNNSTGVRK